MTNFAGARSNAALKIVALEAEQAKAETKLPDDEGGDSDEPERLTVGDRLEIAQACLSCYTAVCASDTVPTPLFEHPLTLAKSITKWIETGE